MTEKTVEMALETVRGEDRKCPLQHVWGFITVHDNSNKLKLYNLWSKIPQSLPSPLWNLKSFMTLKLASYIEEHFVLFKTKYKFTFTTVRKLRTTWYDGIFLQIQYIDQKWYGLYWQFVNNKDHLATVQSSAAKALVPGIHVAAT